MFLIIVLFTLVTISLISCCVVSGQLSKREIEHECYLQRRALAVQSMTSEQLAVWDASNPAV